ncbi:MAG TPA: hypothetical protein VMK12_10325 [Anaeromyxobacteraceae bacterium]|nr:hypothetical protein [Anaeromyxobacteraceae bacterium]
MTKLAARIATGIAVLSLSAPVFAATVSDPATTTPPAARTSVLHGSDKEKKVARGEKAKTKKVEKKGAAKSTKTGTPATPSVTSAPASK